jgi:hypothetical protein
MAMSSLGQYYNPKRQHEKNVRAMMDKFASNILAKENLMFLPDHLNNLQKA